jgi:anti-sigma-K factor RskA
MTHHEARFILGACRPDGRDAADPMFTEALALAERDPELRRWFERQRSLDATLAAKLQQVAPPAELREAIMAGVRASQPRRPWWAHRGWLAAAAAIAIIATVSVTLGPMISPAPPLPALTTTFSGFNASQST